MNHSPRFARSFIGSLTLGYEACHRWDLQAQLKALQIPSYFVRITDGLTISAGESLLVHVIVALGRDRAMRWHLLDLTPVGQHTATAAGAAAAGAAGAAAAGAVEAAAAQQLGELL